MAGDSLPVEHLFTLEITAEMAGAHQIHGGPAGRRIIACCTYEIYALQ
jgi:hypothetical protein